MVKRDVQLCLNVQSLMHCLLLSFGREYINVMAFFFFYRSATKIVFFGTPFQICRSSPKEDFKSLASCSPCPAPSCTIARPEMAETHGKFDFAIDRGGTFTDVFAHLPDGRERVLKLLSHDPQNYKDAPTEGIRRVLEQVRMERVIKGVEVKKIQRECERKNEMLVNT